MTGGDAAGRGAGDARRCSIRDFDPGFAAQETAETAAARARALGERLDALTLGAPRPGPP